MFLTELGYSLISSLTNLKPDLNEIQNYPLMVTFSKPLKLQRPNVVIQNSADLKLLSELDKKIQLLIGNFMHYLSKPPDLTEEQFHNFIVSQVAAMDKFNFTSALATDARSYLSCLDILLCDYTLLKDKADLDIAKCVDERQCNIKKISKRIAKWIFATATFFLLRHLSLAAISIINWSHEQHNEARSFLNHDILKSKPWLLKIISGNLFDVIERPGNFFREDQLQIHYNSANSWLFTFQDWINENTHEFFVSLIHCVIPNVNRITISTLLYSAYNMHMVYYGVPYITDRVMHLLGKCLSFIKWMSIHVLINAMVTRQLFNETEMYKKYQILLQLAQDDDVPSFAACKNRLLTICSSHTTNISEHEFNYIKQNPQIVFGPAIIKIQQELNSKKHTDKITNDRFTPKSVEKAVTCCSNHLDDFYFGQSVQDLDQEIQEIHDANLESNNKKKYVKVGLKSFIHMRDSFGKEGIHLAVMADSSLKMLRRHCI